MPRFRTHTRPRRGFFLKECLMAVLIIATAIAGAGELMRRVVRQRYRADARAIAQREISNVMEDLVSRRWDDLSPQLELPLSAATTSRLRDPQLRIQVTEPGDSTPARRIVVELDWQGNDSLRSGPVRLVAWRYPPPEQQP